MDSPVAWISIKQRQRVAVRQIYTQRSNPGQLTNRLTEDRQADTRQTDGDKGDRNEIQKHAKHRQQMADWIDGQTHTQTYRGNKTQTYGQTTDKQMDGDNQLPNGDEWTNKETGNLRNNTNTHTYVDKQRQSQY